MVYNQKILILGGTGLLAQAVNMVASKEGYEVFSLSKSQGFDLSRADAGLQLTEAFNRIRPSLIFNATGITDLQFCETNPDQAWMLHARLPSLIAALANRTQCPWVHISTDHYFSGHANILHTESAPPNTPNEYARSKLAGEVIALTSSTAFVVRTNIIGKRGWTDKPNFAEWAIRCLHDQMPFDAYTDTWASSIEAGQLANLVLKLVKSGETGLMNLACSESVSKADLIEKIANRFRLNPHLMNKVETPKAGLYKMQRANAMGLDCTKAQQRLGALGLSLPDTDEVVSALFKIFSE